MSSGERKLHCEVRAGCRGVIPHHGLVLIGASADQCGLALLVKPVHACLVLQEKVDNLRLWAPQHAAGDGKSSVSSKPSGAGVE